MTLLSAENLLVRLGGRTILSGVDLGVLRAEVVGLIGPNGAGKTTLLRTLCGLLRPDRGRVLLDGAPLASLSSAARARKMAYFAQSAAIYWPMTVARVVALGRLPYLGPWQQPGPDDFTAMESAMADCEVTTLADRPVSELSGGERARAMLARALASEPQLLLADEPVAGLDPYHQLQVMELMSARARRGMGVVVVLHDLALAARFCDRLVLLAGGELAAAGPPAEVLKPDLLERVYGVRMGTAIVDGERLLVPWTRSPAGHDGAGGRGPLSSG